MTLAYTHTLAQYLNNHPDAGYFWCDCIVHNMPETGNPCKDELTKTISYFDIVEGIWHKYETVDKGRVIYE